MQNIFFQTICKIGIFMICAQAVIHFRPRESYEKYLKLLVSAMILIQLFLPVGSFLLGGGMEQTLKRLELLRTQLEQEMDSAAREAANTDRLLEQMTLEEVRKRVEERERQAEEAGNIRDETRAGTNEAGEMQDRTGTGNMRNETGEIRGETEEGTNETGEIRGETEEGANETGEIRAEIEEVPEVTVTVGPIEIQ